LDALPTSPWGRHWPSANDRPGSGRAAAQQKSVPTPGHALLLKKDEKEEKREIS
jgi:hypothetical protein